MFWSKLCNSNRNCAWNLAFISCTYLTYCMEYVWTSSLWIGIFPRATQRAGILYSYFEKGCWKKCTRQSRKVLWVVLSSLFFKEIWKNGTRGCGRMFARAKEKQRKKFLQLQCQKQCSWSYPILPFGIVACTFLPTTFLEIAVYRAGAAVVSTITGIFTD